jgi:hypothetical protein
VCTCPPGTTRFPDPTRPGSYRCIDLTADPNNCGALNNQCTNRQACFNVGGHGTCQCRPGLTLVAGQCVDLQTDPRNCGTPGRICPRSAPVCVAGTCQANMACTGSGGTICFGGFATDAMGSYTLSRCVRTRSDELNCGACGNVCGNDEVCVLGTCREYRPAISCTTCPCLTVCPAGTSCCNSYTGSTSTPRMCVTGAGCP